MITYQDFLQAGTNIADFVAKAISEYRSSKFYRMAVEADKYNAQQNVTINEYVRTIFTLSGSPVEDFTASNNKIASNFFHRLNTQRCTYSLGNGVSFTDTAIKDSLGKDFDTQMWDIGFNALIHGICFGFWNLNKLYVFKATEFVPLWDEEDGTLKAGIRFWQLDKNKPMMAILYEVDGYTKFKDNKDDAAVKFVEVEPKQAYITKIAYTEAGDKEVIGVENYSALPIIPMWGSKLHQSTLIGMKEAIDSYDLIRSGFANDLTDCSQIYWIVENCGGMSDADLARFRDKLKITHIAEVDGDAGAKATPYTQEIPFTARQAYLDSIRSGIYEDFGGLDVHAVAAGATNDHIDAAYQPMDENADDFEYNVTEFVRQLLNLMGVDDYPIFKRNRISNELEQTQMILMAAEYLDEETVLTKLPFITIDEVEEILARKDEESYNNYEAEESVNEEDRSETGNGDQEDISGERSRAEQNIQ